MIEERPSRLDWEGTLNARDLGGYPTTDGGRTRWGAIVRSDHLSRLTDAGKQAVIAHGVRTIIDLRFDEELARHPNPFAEIGDHGIRYHHVSLLDPQALPSTETTLANNYVEVLNRFQGHIGEVVRLIADADEGAVLFHCMGGKDRTGTIAALLLDLVGVPRDLVARDYAITAENLREADREYLENGTGTREERERTTAWWRAREEVMLEVLARLEATHGDVEQYLLAAGVSADQIARIRQRLVERDPA